MSVNTCTLSKIYCDLVCGGVVEYTEDLTLILNVEATEVLVGGGNGVVITASNRRISGTNVDYLLIRLEKASVSFKLRGNGCRNLMLFVISSADRIFNKVTVTPKHSKTAVGVCHSATS